MLGTNEGMMVCQLASSCEYMRCRLTRAVLFHAVTTKLTYHPGAAEVTYNLPVTTSR